MNALQHIPKDKYGPVLVTLNAPFEPDASTVRGRWRYDHPVLDQHAIEAQNRMYTIQHRRGISFAGAYLNFGFHEDGFTSGLVAASGLPRVKLPFELRFADGGVWDTRTTPKASEKDRVIEWTATFFDVLQAFGIRHVMGRVLGFTLWYYLFLLSLVGIRFEF